MALIKREAAEAIRKYAEWCGAVHDDDCPADDTCDCSGKWINDGLQRALELLEQAQPRPEKAWRCFHCDEVFTDEVEAREHFGVENGYGLNLSACKITIGDVRGLELEVTKLRADNATLENDARLWHEADDDRKRRIGNVQWWQELDSREGEKLVLQERVAELEAKLAAPLRELLQAQGQIIPVYNDEFVEASWVREVASRGLKALESAADAARMVTSRLEPSGDRQSSVPSGPALGCQTRSGSEPDICHPPRERGEWHLTEKDFCPACQRSFLRDEEAKQILDKIVAGGFKNRVRAALRPLPVPPAPPADDKV